MTEKRPRSQVTVRFQDCDAFGHLNNVRYIDYFLNAREDHLNTYYRFSLTEHARAYGANWVITKHEIAYLRPAFPGEKVTIQTALISLDDGRLKVEGLMLDAAERVKAVQWTTFRYVDLSSGRPRAHPPEVTTLLQSLVHAPDAPPASLDQRIRGLKQTRKEPA